MFCCFIVLEAGSWERMFYNIILLFGGYIYSVDIEGGKDEDAANF